MDQDSKQQISSSQIRSFLQAYVQSYDQIQQLTIEEINQLTQTLKNKEPQKIQEEQYEQEKEKEKQLIDQKQKTKQKAYFKQLALLSNYSYKDKNKDKIIEFSFQNTQKELNSEQVVRKSRRIRDKSKRKQFSSQPRKNYTSMIKNIEKQHKSEDIKQFNRPFIQRLKNPGNSTLRQTKITFLNNQFFYSINIHSQQYCSKHKIDKKSSQNPLPSLQQILKQQSLTCKFCKKAGTYWFSSQQLLKYNNGNFIRKYLETFI